MSTGFCNTYQKHSHSSYRGWLCSEPALLLMPANKLKPNFNFQHFKQRMHLLTLSLKRHLTAKEHAEVQMQTHNDVSKCRWGRKTQLQRILLSVLTFFFMAVLGITHLQRKDHLLTLLYFRHLQASLQHPNPTHRSTVQKGKHSHPDIIPPSLHLTRHLTASAPDGTGKL